MSWSIGKSAWKNCKIHKLTNCLFTKDEKQVKKKSQIPGWYAKSVAASSNCAGSTEYSSAIVSVSEREKKDVADGEEKDERVQKRAKKSYYWIGFWNFLFTCTTHSRTLCAVSFTVLLPPHFCLYALADWQQMWNSFNLNEIFFPILYQKSLIQSLFNNNIFIKNLLIVKVQI